MLFSDMEMVLIQTINISKILHQTVDPPKATIVVHNLR